VAGIRAKVGFYTAVASPLFFWQEAHLVWCPTALSCVDAIVPVGWDFGDGIKNTKKSRNYYL